MKESYFTVKSYFMCTIQAERRYKYAKLIIYWNCLLAHHFNSLAQAILFTMTPCHIRSFHRNYLFEYTNLKNTKLVHLLTITGSHSICNQRVNKIVILSWEQIVMPIIISVSVPFNLLMTGSVW